MTVPHIVIERLRAEDLDDVFRLGCETPQFQVLEDGAGFHDPEALLRWLDSPDDLLLAVRVDGTLAGFGLVMIHPHLRYAYLSDVGFDPQFRGMGLGTRLFDHIEAELTKRNIEHTWAIVRTNNEPIQNLLKKRGYSIGLPWNYVWKDV